MKYCIKRKDWVTAAAALAFTSTFIAFGLSMAELAAVWVSSFVAASALDAWMDKRDAHLVKRMEDTAPAVWDVRMSGVSIGAVTDAQYASMQRHAFHDKRNAAAQLLNMAHVLLTVLRAVFIGTPLTIFWLMVMLALFKPQALTDIVQGFHQAGAAAAGACVLALLPIGVSLTVTALIFMSMWGFSFGYRNRYGEEVNRMLRRHCNMPAEGDVHLWQGDKGLCQTVRAPE